MTDETTRRTRIAIAGASGFVGRALRRRLADRFDLIALTRRPSNDASIATDEDGVEWRQCDLFDPASIASAIEGVDALIWQLAASVALPGYTIHQLVAIVVALLDASGVDQTGVISALPTACGLAMIPFIVKPLDELAEVAMDVTFRKVSAPYLESCEV